MQRVARRPCLLVQNPAIAVLFIVGLVMRDLVGNLRSAAATSTTAPQRGAITACRPRSPVSLVKDSLDDVDPRQWARWMFSTTTPTMIRMMPTHWGHPSASWKAAAPMAATAAVPAPDQMA